MVAISTAIGIGSRNASLDPIGKEQRQILSQRFNAQKATTWRALFFGVQLEQRTCASGVRSMLAVLKDALLNFRKNLHNPNKLFKADRAWFFQNYREDL